MISTLFESFRGFSQAAAPVVVTALWQGAILACGLAVCLRIAPRVSAAHRFWIWAAGFAVVVLLPALPLIIARFFAGGGMGVLSSGAGLGQGGALLRLDLRWSLVIGALWIAASVFRAVELGVHSLRLRKLWKTARPVSAFPQQCGCPWSGVPTDRSSSVGWGSLALGDQGKRNLNLGRRAIEVCTTTELDRPSVIGFFAPRILIPEWLYARLTREELEQVVLHESEHLRRHDDWTNLLQKLCLVVFPLNPALAWMERRLCREREMACDDGVVRATQAPRAYAACLASLAERGLERRAEALSLGAWQRRPEVVERVHRILRRTPGLSPMAATALVGAMGCGLVFGSIEFAKCPQLVAFVPAARQDAARLGDARVGARFTNADYVTDERGGNVQGFRAMDAMAHMPGAMASQRNAGSLQQAQGEKSNRSSLHSLSLPSVQDPVAQDDRNVTEVKTASVSGNDASTSQDKPAQQWIVFTAWEQVDSSGAGQGSKQEAGLRQDYNSSATAEQETNDNNTQTVKNGKKQNGDTAAGTTNSIRVTRLILRIYTAGTVSGTDSTSTTGQFSTTDHPALIPLRDGWFVFQL